MIPGKLTAVLCSVAGCVVAIVTAGVALTDAAARKDLLGRIEALDAAVPVDLVDVTRSIEEIGRDGEKAEALCRDFLARWPGGADSWKVKGILLRMLRAPGRSRTPADPAAGPEADAAIREMEIHEKEAVEIARGAIGREELGPAERHVALEILIERASPDLGGLEGIGARLEALAAEYSRRIAGLPDGPLVHRLQNRLWASNHLLSRIRLGLGMRAEARRIRVAMAVRRGIPPTDDFFLRFLDKIAGGTLESGLADAVWVSEARLDPKADRGSVVILLTHGIARPAPSEQGMKEIQRLVDERRGEGLLGAIVSFSGDAGGARAASNGARELRKDLETFGIKLPAAVLPSSRWSSLFPRSCGGTCVLLNRRGEVAWDALLLANDRQELALSHMVLDRLLAEGRSKDSNP